MKIGELLELVCLPRFGNFVASLIIKMYWRSIGALDIDRPTRLGLSVAWTGVCMTHGHLVQNVVNRKHSVTNSALYCIIYIS